MKADDFEEDDPSDSEPKARRRGSRQKDFLGPNLKNVQLTVLSVKMEPSMNTRKPGDPKPLVTSQFSQKVSIQITLHLRLQKRK